MTKRRIAAAFLLATGAISLGLHFDRIDGAGRQDREKRRPQKNRDQHRGAYTYTGATTVQPGTLPTETKPAKPMNVANVAKFIDAEIDRAAAAKIAPSSRSSDAEFIRRVSLDITGVIPVSRSGQSFLANGRLRQTCPSPSRNCSAMRQVRSTSGRHLGQSHAPAPIQTTGACP